MIEVNLYYIGCFDSKFKDNSYKIYQFLDIQSMTVLTGTNINDNIDLSDYVGKQLTCNIGVKSNKVKVISVKTK